MMHMPPVGIENGKIHFPATAAGPNMAGNQFTQFMLGGSNNSILQDQGLPSKSRSFPVSRGTPTVP